MISEKSLREKDWMTIKEASTWASKYTNKSVTPSNISYLVQYGRIFKSRENGTILISKQALKQYYANHLKTKQSQWEKKLGDDLNWNLSFSEYKESETTKHVHRLHPYKGKFIPQLVEYFLDKHTDEFKKESFFRPGDVILDPFCGSGTTLVQANELNLHSVGIDISAFNVFISNVKLGEYDLSELKNRAYELTQELKNFQSKRNNLQFENNLLECLKSFNGRFFPSPEFRYKVRQKEINERIYGNEKSNEFLTIYYDLVHKYKIPLQQKQNNSFLDQWFLEVVRKEIDFIFGRISLIPDSELKNALSLILSRTIRSCRATSHADLGTLKKPIIETYYCKKHGKICKPVFSILSWWERYTQDSISRLIEFSKLKTKSFQICLVGDSRALDITHRLKDVHFTFGNLVQNNCIAGIFSSPPYVGLIDYHEQHAYAYDLFNFNRKDSSEIGPLYGGQGLKARNSYVRGIADVLNNSKRFLKPNYNIFLVANDKYNLYPKIVQLADMKIVNKYRRPVLNRVEKDRSAYAETIFHIRQK